MYTNQDKLQPDMLDEILALRPEGATKAPVAVDNLESRMKGALIGRFAGCMLPPACIHRKDPGRIAWCPALPRSAP